MSLRETIPVRRQVSPKKKYQKYRNDLERDFNHRCGYCDDSDQFTDPRLFHIDHFAPKSTFPKLKTVYENLVYACCHCNESKSNHWIGDDPSIPNNGNEGFVDPCRKEYDEHLARSLKGKIVARTPLGEYMVKTLKLHLERHAYLWISRRSRKRLEETEILAAEIGRSPNKNLVEENQYLKDIIILLNEIERYEGLARNSTNKE